MRWTGLFAGLTLAAVPLHAAAQTATVSVERGNYIARIGGCDDCHTAGYGEAAGNVPDANRLKGSGVGFRGPWGTTYAANLRIFMQGKSEDEWVAYARTFQARPPMPWFNVRVMEEADLRSLHQFIRSLGDPGEQAPAFVPPDQEPKTPFIVFVPQPPK